MALYKSIIIIITGQATQKSSHLQESSIPYPNKPSQV